MHARETAARIRAKSQSGDRAAALADELDGTGMTLGRREFVGDQEGLVLQFGVMKHRTGNFNARFISYDGSHRSRRHIGVRYRRGSYVR